MVDVTMKTETFSAPRLVDGRHPVLTTVHIVTGLIGIVPLVLAAIAVFG